MPFSPTTSLLRIVLYAVSPDEWCAQALDCDVQCTSRTPETALEALIAVVESHLTADHRSRRAPLGAFAATLQPMWSKFASAAHLNRPVEINRTGGSGRVRYLVATSVEAAGLS